LGAGGSDLKYELPRDNQYLNLALNVKPGYELPSNFVELMDVEQTIEGFLFKKAKQNNLDNFDAMRAAVGDSDISKVTSVEMF